MTTTFTTLVPNGGTVSVAKPPITFSITSDDPTQNLLLEYYVSPSPTPNTDPNAYYGSSTVSVENTGFTAVSVFTLNLPNGATLTPGTWYVYGRVSTVTPSAVISTKTQSFAVVFTPAVTPLTPASGSARLFVSTTSNLLCAWRFAGDETNNDYQTAYQVIVTRVSDNLVVVDTGKVVSTVTQAIVTIINTYSDVNLAWKVRVWNKWDTPSVYSTALTFTLETTNSLTFTAPTVNQVVAAGNPNLTVTVNQSSGRTDKSITASAWQADTKVWEKTVFGNWANGASVNITDSGSVFAVAAYQYRVTALDSLGAYSSEATRNFSVAYTAPATPNNTPTIVTTNYATQGYITVAWNDSTRDVDFLCWAIERRDDLIDPVTQAVIQTGLWAETGRVYTTGASYTFNDYLAPSNYKVSYRIVQVAVKWATEVRSVASGVSTPVFPVSTGYWLYGGVNGAAGSMSLFLSNVASDSYTDEFESATFTIIGRGRYEERGTKLGAKGTLDIKLRDNTFGTARARRILIEGFKDLYPIASLRTPFGDTLNVTLGDISVTRIPGVGSSEFVDVSIPYSEVVS